MQCLRIKDVAFPSGFDLVQRQERKARTEQIESAYPSTADIEVMSSARQLWASSDNSAVIWF
jgi:hypothetical protein